MKTDEFINKRPFLYHLTDKINFNLIKINGLLLCTSTIAGLSELNPEEQHLYLRTRRGTHTSITVGEAEYLIRDQQPISLKNLEKCLTNGWNTGDFLYHLNSRVFFWPTTKRLESHYSRYKEESPIIIKVSSGALIELNPHVEFCRLNSGATRSNSHLNGAPPERGIETFLPADSYTNTIGSVAEVTFPDRCQLPNKIFVGETPNGPWTEITLI